MAWTDERISLLTKMWTDGHTASQIALALGEATTRNAVIGKAHRLGLSGRPVPARAARPATRRPSTPKPLRPHGAKPTRSHAPHNPHHGMLRSAEPPRPVMRVIDVPVGPGVSLLKITDKMCKWPLGHPGDENFRFCGNGSIAGSPYCEGHAQVAYQPLPAKRDRRAG